MSQDQFYDGATSKPTLREQLERGEKPKQPTPKQIEAAKKWVKGNAASSQSISGDGATMYSGQETHDHPYVEECETILTALEQYKPVDVGALKKECELEINETIHSPLNSTERAVMRRTVDHVVAKGLINAK